MSSEVLLLEKSDAIATLTLNRPDAMNALSSALRDAITDAFREVQADPAIRVAILTGAGRAFCAGFDLKELGQGDAERMTEEAQSGVVDAMASFEGPIIAAVNGHAITGGFELALACDMIIASSRAKFADTHARVGILPGWGLSQKLPRLIGIARAKELSFTGNTLTAAQAYEWGLVNRVLEPEELLPTCRALAADMASCVPAVLRGYKKLIDDGYGMNLSDAMAMELERSVESAKRASAALIAERRDAVFERGREQSEKRGTGGDGPS
jgi:enoyl-CoA hydratase